jgi:hypothetical protein
MAAPDSTRMGEVTAGASSMDCPAIVQTGDIGNRCTGHMGNTPGKE